MTCKAFGVVTAKSRDDQKCAKDLVNRNFNTRRPNELQVADFTYIKTTSGWVYTAFIIDVFAHAIVGQKVSNRMSTDMVMTALNQAVVDRNNPKNVVHHSDQGVLNHPHNTGVIKQKIINIKTLYVDTMMTRKLVNATLYRFYIRR